jgi:orotate phosphoribosyltransferase
MSDAETKLLQLLKERSFKRGEFRLASGGTSSYFIDGKMTQVYSEAAFLIGEVLYEHTRDLNLDAIGGLEVGAVPLTTAAVISYHLHGRKLEGFWVRDKVKDHGTKKLIEGNLKPGSRVVIVDDVITQGNSSVKAIQAAREHGCTVVGVVTLVDRLQGARKCFEEQGIENYRSVFTIAQFGVEVDATGETKNAAG